MPEWTVSEESLAELIAGFERCDLPGAGFNHAKHLAVGAWYVWHRGPEGALAQMRVCLTRLNAFHKTPNEPGRGYHETLTRFWIDRIAEWMGRAKPASAFDAIVGVTSEFASRGNLWREYWSYDVVKSAEAKAAWVAPDRLL